MEDLAKMVQRIPKAPGACQLAILEFPGAVKLDDGSEYHPAVPIWVDVESGSSYTDPEAVLAPQDNPFSPALKSLESFLDHMYGARCCPKRIEVRDPDLADYLRGNLEGAGVEIAVVDRLEAMDGALGEMKEQFASLFQGPPSLLDARGATVERIRSFAQAAADFHRAAPWRFLSDVDLIEVESPKPPRSMQCLVVLGAGGSLYGLALYPNRRAFQQFMRAGMEAEFDDAVATRPVQMIFESIEDAPAPDRELWREHQLPLAGGDMIPSTIKYDPDGGLGRPSTKELAYLEAVLRALADSTESDIDSGRWSKQIQSPAGPATVTLRMPDLLDPPTPQDWIRRGFEPDRRAMERLHADIQRSIEELPPDQAEDLDSISRQFSGRSLDRPLTRPRNAVEEAQDLCFQAFEVHGRRRIQLARQALQLDPDCSDGYAILAEEARSLDDELDLFRKAAEAAERRLGASFFAENQGNFWRIAATRPYMRACMGLADALERADRLDEAIERYRTLLRLNPDDDQGARYRLLSILLAEGRDAEAARHLKEFEETSAIWAYARVLLAYRLSGPSAAAAKELHQALRLNPHAPKLLEEDPDFPLPTRYSPGSEEEALIVADELAPAFHDAAGVFAWMHEEQERELRSDLRRRQEERRKLRAEKKKKRKRR